MKFDELPKQLHARLLERITSLTDKLRSRVVAEIPRRTGKLAGEVKSSVRDRPDRIVGEVEMTDEFAKAGALEYGGSGRQFKVKGYEADRSAAFGKRLNAPTAKLISAYNRSINFPGRRFLRGPLAAMNEEIVAGITEAVSETVNEGE